MSEEMPQDGAQTPPEVALQPEQAYVALDDLLRLAGHYAELLNAHDGGERKLPSTVRGWVDKLGEQGRLPSRPVPVDSIYVESIVASRNHRPYVRVSTPAGIVTQLDTPTARVIAGNLLTAAAAAEADAMIFRFFGKAGFPEGAARQMMADFREFRAEIDASAGEESPT